MMSDETETTTEEVGSKTTESKTEAKSDSKPSDEAAKLLKEVMKLKREKQDAAEALKRFEGIDPDAVRSRLAEKAEREAAAATAEEERLKKIGEFETLQRATKEAHQRELEAERAKLKAREDAEEKAQAQIRELTVGAAFANSQFLRDDTVLPPSKARRAYEAHFDVVDGRVQAFSKERGEDGREPLVDGSGAPLAFDAAMKRIIEADPDRDHLLRAKPKQGSGTTPAAGGKPAPGASNAKPTPMDIIRGALPGLARPDK